MKKLVLILFFLFLAIAAPVRAAEMAGIYVQCPKKNPAACPQVVEEFRRLFPNGQTASYLMLRKDGGGYLTVGDDATTAFTWQMSEGGLLLLKMSDAARSKVEYQVNGLELVNLKTGEQFLRSHTDEEWNPAPRPFKEINKRSGANK